MLNAALWHRYLTAEASTGAQLSFEDWAEETDAWHVVEGEFVGVGVVPQIVADGCAPPPIGTAAARAAARASSAFGKTDGAWLTWVFDGDGKLTRTDLEQLQHTYSAAAVGRQAQATESMAVDEIEEAATAAANGGDSDEPVPSRAMWNEAKVVAFSIECREQVCCD